MAFPIDPFIMVNRNGIPRLEGTAGTPAATTGNIVYTFKQHRFLNYPYAGLLIFKLSAQPSTPVAAGSVMFDSGNNNAVTVYKFDGSALASNDAALADGGVFIAWYSDNKLLLLTSV